MFDGSSDCVACPPNSYCDGNLRNLCSVQFVSPMYSKVETDCECVPGFFFDRITTMCRMCVIGSKCPGGRDGNVDIQCSPEELCPQRGMYIPLACPRGTSTRNIFPQSDSTAGKVCSSNGIVEIGFADVLFANEVRKNGNIYRIENVPLMDACDDATFGRNMIAVLTQQQPMLVIGFFGVFQHLCGPERVLVRNASAHNTGSENPLRNAFRCFTPIIRDHTLDVFLVHTGLAVIARQRMGLNGFLSESYHDSRLSLLDPDSHLMWNIFMACDFRNRDNGTAMAGVSEIDTCFQCEYHSDAGFLVLDKVAKYNADVDEPDTDYTTDVLYVNLDTASQLMWAQKLSPQLEYEPNFVVMQVVRATPQKTRLLPYISVRVFAKEIGENNAPEVLITQRKHILYDEFRGDQGVSDRSEIERLVFALQVPNAGYRMTAHNKVLVGACLKNRYQSLPSLLFSPRAGYVFSRIFGKETLLKIATADCNFISLNAEWID